MKIYKPSESLRQKRKESIDFGFDSKDSKMLDQESDYSPKVLMFTKSKPDREHLDRLDEKQYCSCGGDLTLLQKTQVLLCSQCGNSIPVLNSSPLYETNQDLKPFGTQVDNEIGRPFMVGLVDSEPQEPDWEVTSSSSDGRIQNIKLKKGVSPTCYRIKPDD